MLLCLRVRQAFAIGVGLALVLIGPAAISGEMVGSPMAETYGHAWVRWWTAAEWPAWSQGTTLVEGARSWPVIDPLPTWVFGGVAQIVGDTWAWNLSAALGIVVTALGGGALARSLRGSPIFGAAISPVMPIYLGSIHSGLTEDYFLGFVGLSLAAGVEKRWVSAGLWAGISAWCGLYLGWFAGVGLAVLAGFRAIRWLWRVLRQYRAMPPRTMSPLGWILATARAVSGPLLGLSFAAAISLGAAWPFLTVLQDHGPVRPPPVNEPFYALNPWRAADLASFLTPGSTTTDARTTAPIVMRQHPTYVGGVTVFFAIMGGMHPAGIAVAALGVASLGDEISWMGNPTGLGNPISTLLHKIPMGDKFRNHARLMLLGQLILVALASRGARNLVVRIANDPVRSLRAGTVVAVSVVMAETILLSPAPLPLRTTPTTGPAIYEKIPAGRQPILVIGEHNPQKPLYDQRFHGHPLLNNPNRPAPKPSPKTTIVVVFRPANPDFAAPPLPVWLETLGPPDAIDSNAELWFPAR